jgi:hypothetical protein
MGTVSAAPKKLNQTTVVLCLKAAWLVLIARSALASQNLLAYYLLACIAIFSWPAYIAGLYILFAGLYIIISLRRKASHSHAHAETSAG